MNTIYEPKGRAREYSPLALNLYNGCVHGCRYCFGPKVCRRTREEFHAISAPRPGIMEALEREAPKYKGDPREILLCFTSDPYQPLKSPGALVTREALATLAAAGCRATVLTKGGTRAVRDFDILAGAGFRFGSTIAFYGDAETAEWEPDAAPYADRLAAIQEAKRQGIATWVSIEPVIDPMAAFDIVSDLHDVVDRWKIGKVNHSPELEAKVDWTAFLQEIIERLEEFGADYYIKDSLAAFGPVPEHARRRA